MAMSQKSTYTEWYGEMICAGLAEGQSLLATCEALGVPVSTAWEWERDIPQHAENATRAREAGCHVMACEMKEIADTPQMGVIRITKDDGKVEEREEDMTQHRRLRIETRKWLLSKWASKIYGDKQQIEHSGGISLAEVLREAKAKRKGGA
jgi:hypothetical protein